MEKVAILAGYAQRTSSRQDVRDRMSCRKNHILRIAAVGVFILLMYGSYWYSSNSYGTDLRSWERSTNRRMLNSHKHYGSYGGYGGRAGSSYDTYPPMTTAHSTNITIENVLSIQRELIAAEWSNSNDDPKLLHGLTPETDGNPMRSVIITTWRSGSTFLGDILNSLPGNFYHYEPLLDFDIVQIRGPPNDSVALHNLRNLLHCDYNEMENYLEFGRTHSYLFSHNTRLWQQCVRLQQFCYEPRFLGPFCRLFPRQSMKVVRLRLALATPLLEDDSLNVRVVLLIRDPRAVIQSRKHRDWCPGQPDCDDPGTVCSDMEQDYEAAIELSKRFPQRFRVVRYEDLSLNPYKMTKEILQFYGLPYNVEVEAFLDTHTKQDIGGVSSTYRDSKSTPFHWMKKLPFYEVKTIQDSCRGAMKSWGYRIATSERELEGGNFNPLLPYSVS